MLCLFPVKLPAATYTQH